MPRRKILFNILISLIIPIVIYFGIASILIATGKPGKSTADQKEIWIFKELYFDYSSLPEFQNFKARDGKELYYRYYPAQSNDPVILIHRFRLA